MRRRLFNLAAAVSLLLLTVALCASWFWSYRAGTQLVYCADRGADGMWRDRYLVSQRGRLHFIAFRNTRRIFRDGSRFHVSSFQPSDPAQGDQSWRFMGFWYASESNLPAREWRDWGAPYWVLVLLTAVPTTWLLFRNRYFVRRGSGRCPTCGYDLRATPERCPECGTMVGERAAV